MCSGECQGDSVGYALHHLLSWLDCLVLDVAVENVRLFMIVNRHYLWSYEAWIGNIRMMNIVVLETLS